MVLHNLGEVADGHSAGDLHFARGGRLLTANQFEQGRFARTVLAHQTNLVILTDVKIDVVQQGEASEGDGERVYRDHSATVRGRG